ncbi:glycosyltransferase family 1 protein [Anabaena sp. UHCC 0253]|uniref:glycosyltransferase family 1 protein n=1 Tax=Anabaena sp. UHCC 0253 TaxID=2590019 RepID=UPI001446F83B|nr:glycosyltransferase family 1 protein [Anabaena sp. UHCC 0253]MTJ53681.1 glycosyltransferase family 1 protein [Anabaena sp. UHCC 0253]
MNIIQIVPRLPPAIDGVGDYALNLARQLRKDFSIHTHFIVGNSTWKGTAEIEGFTVNQITDNSANTLLTLLSCNDSSSSILLHYVGYGYAQRGCPVWLVEGLQRWKSLYPKSNLVTMFHELYASGYPPWTSSFWLFPLQKSLAARLAQLSDRCVTSKKLYADIITQISQGKHNQVLFLPVFSTVGEPEKLPPDLSERQHRLVIFGGVANRARVYNQSQEVLDYVCQRLNIKEICDIGTPTGITPSSIGKVPILEIGKQAAHKVSDILADSIAGFSDYNPDYLAKSTIFAAYCAYRLLPINAKGSVSVIDGIEAGKHYWIPNAKENNWTNELDLQTIADKSYYWYQSHNLSSHITVFVSQLLLNLNK